MVATGDDAVCPTCGQAFHGRVAHCPNDGTRLVQRRAHAVAIGRVLDGKYEVVAPMAEGVLGAIYRGRQLTIERDVAIKVIRPAFAMEREGAERFVHAAQLACQLVAPSIATTYDFGRASDGVLYLVMELVRGRSLADELAGGRLPVHRGVTIGLQIADALVAAQHHRAWHGDLKPTNILVAADASRSELVKVVDFGLARAFVPDPWSVDARLASYAAPELAEGHLIGPRSDLYALGALLHHLLTGTPPFVDSSTKTLLDKHRREPPPRLPRGVPPALATIVSRLLSKSPRDRFDSTAAARDALAAIAGRSPLSAVPSTIGDEARGGATTGAHSQPQVTGLYTSSGTQPPTGPSAGAPVPVDVRPVATAPRSPASSSSRAIVIGIVAFVVIALGLVGYLVLGAQ